jgi:hypothetical protein
LPRDNPTRNGLSQVVSALILLVVAVLLAAAVTYYATNITMTRTTMEEVLFSKEHIWCNETGSVAGFKLQNVGGRDILLDKIAIRGVEQTWSDVYFYRVPADTLITADVNVTNPEGLTGSSVEIDGRNFTQAISDIPLQSGCELIVYVKDPPNIQPRDVGKSVNLMVVTNNSEYITECNVESLTQQ